MLSKNQEKLIKSLKTKKARKKHKLCLVEGKKVIEMAKKHIKYTFSDKDTKLFKNLVTTQTPQPIAAVAKIPEWKKADIQKKDIIIVLDGVQDPGNVGSILRLCLGFNASLVLVDSADATSPKVIRASVGAIFQVPWMQISRSNIDDFIKKTGYQVYRLEKTKKAIKLKKSTIKTPSLIIAGSEGKGIKLDTKGISIYIEHNKKLESLNVGHALAITLNSVWLADY